MDDNMKRSVECVEALIDKAALTKDAPAAMNYAQAALNAAHALRTLVDIRSIDS